jgi:hypothetical protein
MPRPKKIDWLSTYSSWSGRSGYRPEEDKLKGGSLGKQDPLRERAASWRLSRFVSSSIVEHLKVKKLPRARPLTTRG